MPKVWNGFLYLMVLSWCCSAQLVAAEGDATPQLDAETKFVVHINAEAARNTEFGKNITELVRKQILQELGKGSGKRDDVNIDEVLDKINKTLGFDPFEEIVSVTMSARSFEEREIEKCLVVDVLLKSSTGNLEGLALGLPGYESKEIRGTLLHSAPIENGKRVHWAVFEQKSGQKLVRLAFNPGDIESLLGSRLTIGLDSEQKNDLFQPEKKAIFQLTILSIPMDKLGEGPQNNVAKIIDQMSLSVHDQEKLEVVLSARAKSDKQAEQLQQLTQGLVAGVDLAQTMNPDEQDLKEIKRYYEAIEVSREGRLVRAKIVLNRDEVFRAAKMELKIDF